MSLDPLNRKLKEQRLIGYWTIPNTSTGFREPGADFRPFLWKWSEIHRHTHRVAYHAFRGRGTTVMGDRRFAWEQGDSFVLPLWSWHAHENTASEPAVLFSINDRPAIEALDHYREETR